LVIESIKTDADTTAR